MERIKANADLHRSLHSDGCLRQVRSVDVLVENYEAINERFHSYFAPQNRAGSIENARYHKGRYIDLLRNNFTGSVLDVGNDKTFLSFFLRAFNSMAEFTTISFVISDSPYDLFAVDIESESLPFDDERYDCAIFTEVIEHLWRNPSFALAEINRSLKNGGELLLTTPNPCERHAITCALWQANPNQRSQIFTNLESGHIHLWSIPDLRVMLEAHGFHIRSVATKDYYGYSQRVPAIEEVIRSISPHPDLMGESIVIEAERQLRQERPIYPKQIYPDEKPVAFDGALKHFATGHIREALGPAPSHRGSGRPPWETSTTQSWNSRQAIGNYSTGGNLSIWASNQISANGPYQIAEAGQGGDRVFKGDFKVEFTPKFHLGADAKLFAAGSDFMREIEGALSKKGVSVLSWTPESEIQNEWMHRYTTHAIIGDFKMALEDGYDQNNIVPYGNNWVDFTGHGQADTKGELLEQRMKILDIYRNAQRADAILLTLGLVEVWYDTQTGQYLNIPPWGHFMSSRFELRVTGYVENRASLEAFAALVRRRVRPDLKIVMSVSPVPLGHTFSGKDIVLANAYSKAVLRAVAQDIANGDPNTDYFPCYEMVMNADPATAWYPDHRHVRREFVERIVDLFYMKYMG